MKIKETLSHPMLLLVVGAIVTSLIIPYFTRQWQDYQHEMELKGELSDQINKAVSNVLTDATINVNPSYARNQTQKYLDTYADFQTAKDIIESKIIIYFHDNQITKKWDNLANSVNNFLDVSTSVSHSYYNYSMCNRLGKILQIHALIPTSNTININRSVFDSLHCNHYFPGLEYKQQLHTSFPVDNNGIDWNALLFQHSSVGDFSRSFSI